MPTTLTHGIQLPDKGSVDWYSSMQSNYNLIDTHLGDTDVHVTAEDKANWNSKQGSLSQAQLDAIAQVATNTSDIATLQSGKANASHTHSSSDITDIGDYATKQYVDTSISGLVDNAPAALDTLNELSAALNDDANFASTVTTALAAKADSADLATVATSGSYNDLDDKPTINDSTITIQKNGSTVDTFTTNGSAKTINIPVPTKTSDLTNDSNFVVSSNLATIATSGDYDDLSNKPSIPTNTSDLTNDSGFVTLNDFDIPAKTSDLTNDSGFITSSDVPTSTSDLINDSNFVDTSNPAVASGITSAKVTDYDTHIADTDIHVTTADKTKWNNQTYVFRYSSTALVASSTNSNTLLDNTDNLKVGDKVIDSSGVLFSVTAIDTVNSTFTIGTALIDLAQDSDVVHTSGDESIDGSKTFGSNTYIYNSDNTATTPTLFLKNSKTTKGSTSEIGAQLLRFIDKNNNNLCDVESIATSTGSCELRLRSNTLDSNDQNVQTGVTLISSRNGGKNFCPTSDNSVFLGASALKWARVYSTQYYYGNNNVEFSTKFVTTDTNQTIHGAKTFNNHTYIYDPDATATTPNLYLRSSKIEISSQGNTSGSQDFTYLDKNKVTYANVKGAIQSNGSVVKIRAIAKDSSDNSVVNELQMLAYTNGNKAIFPSYSNEVDLGVSGYKWKSFNGVEPSSLSLPSDRSARIDISSYITNLGNGDNNQYIVPANGYIWLHFTSINSALCYSQTSGGLTNYAQTFVRYQGDGQLYAFFPVRKNDYFIVQIYTSSTAVVQSAYFIPCQGNV